MSDDTKYEILSAINRYLAQKKEHPDYIDFYMLYGIDKDLKSSELKPSLRKVRKLFHEDQIVYLPQIYWQVYKEIIEVNKELYEFEINNKKKIEYDEMLKSKQPVTNPNINTQQTSSSNSNTQQTNPQYQKTSNSNPDVQQTQNRDVFTAEDERKLVQLNEYIKSIILEQGFAAGYAFLSKLCHGDNAWFYIKLITHEAPENNIKNSIMTFFTKLIIEYPEVGERANDFYDSLDSYLQNHAHKAAYDLIFERMTKNSLRSRIELDKGLQRAEKRIHREKIRNKYSSPYGLSMAIEAALKKEPTFSQEDILILMYSRLHRFNDNINNEFATVINNGGGSLYYIIDRFITFERKFLFFEDKMVL